MFTRALRLPEAGRETFFLWGPRQTGKTTLLLKGLRHLREDHPRARRVVVCLEPKRRKTEDGIDILPVRAFIEELGALLSA